MPVEQGYLLLPVVNQKVGRSAVSWSLRVVHTPCGSPTPIISPLYERYHGASAQVNGKTNRTGRPAAARRVRAAAQRDPSVSPLMPVLTRGRKSGWYDLRSTRRSRGWVRRMGR